MQWTVIGHDGQKEYIDRLLSGSALAHAYLLAGPSGLGKRLFAEDVVRALHEGRLISRNPDHMVLMPGIHEDTGKPTDIPVEAVRDMKVWAYQKPLYGAVKTVIVDDADRLGDAAANTFLKVLEEPPAYVHFLLLTARPGDVLATIASRCQEMTFGLLSDAQMNTVLAGVRIDADDAQLLRAVASGRPGIAQTLLRDKRLPVVARRIAQLEQVLKSGIAERLVAAKTIAEDDALSDTVSWWLSWVHAQLGARPQLAPVAHGLLELSSAVSESKFNKRLALERFFLELPV
jgi:DNA polymerase III subunit delta'